MDTQLPQWLEEEALAKATLTQGGGPGAIRPDMIAGMSGLAQMQAMRQGEAEGKVVHFGRQLATAEARLYGPDGTLYAHGTTTCMVFDLPTAR